MLSRYINNTCAQMIDDSHELSQTLSMSIGDPYGIGDEQDLEQELDALLTAEPDRQPYVALCLPSCFYT